MSCSSTTRLNGALEGFASLHAQTLGREWLGLYEDSVEGVRGESVAQPQPNLDYKQRTGPARTYGGYFTYEYL